MIRLFLATLLLCHLALAEDSVQIRYKDSRNHTHFAAAKVEKWQMIPPHPSDPAGLPIQAYRLTFRGDDGQTRTALTTQTFLNEYQRLDAYLKNKPAEVWQVERTTGGYSAGTQSGAVLSLERGRSGGIIARGCGTEMRFQDYYRGLSSQGDPVLTLAGTFDPSWFSKFADVVEWKNGEPKFANVAGKFEYPHVGDGDLRSQRYLLDFGKNPFDKSKQLLYSVYVDRFEGDDAIVIAPHELQKLEGARQGTKAKIKYWKVPKALLRVAPTGGEGDRLLRSARSQFIDDAAEAKKRSLPIDFLIRANRYQADQEIEVDVGESMAHSVRNLNNTLSQLRSLGPCDSSYSDSSPSA